MIKTSSYELSIIFLLKNENIKFEREKQFKDFRKGTYRYDFFVPSSNLLIEVDGAQHFQFVSYFYRKKSDFTKAQERDRLKNSFALSQGICLCRIPFWEVSRLKGFSDILQDKFIVKNQFHNDEIWNEHKRNNK